VERILFLFVAEFTARFDLMRTILNYTERTIQKVMRDGWQQATFGKV
jgi:hypothetical protein